MVVELICSVPKRVISVGLSHLPLIWRGCLIVKSLNEFLCNHLSVGAQVIQLCFVGVLLGPLYLVGIVVEPHHTASVGASNLTPWSTNTAPHILHRK